MPLLLLNTTIKLAFVAVCVLAAVVCIQEQRSRRKKVVKPAVPAWHINTKPVGHVQRAVNSDR